MMFYFIFIYFSKVEIYRTGGGSSKLQTTIFDERIVSLVEGKFQPLSSVWDSDAGYHEPIQDVVTDTQPILEYDEKLESMIDESSICEFLFDSTPMTSRFSRPEFHKKSVVKKRKIDKLDSNEPQASTSHSLDSPIKHKKVCQSAEVRNKFSSVADERIKLINMQQDNMNKEGEMKLNVIEIDREIRMKELDLKVLELKEKREEIEYNKKMREMNIEQKLKEIERSETLFLLELRRKKNEIRLQEAQMENDQREKGAIYRKEL